MNYLLSGNLLLVRFIFIILITYIIATTGTYATPLSKGLRLFPMPQEVNIHTGIGLTSSPNSVLYEKDTQPLVLPETMTDLPVVKRVSKGTIRFIIDLNLKLPVETEGYVMEISNNVITIRAKERAGLFYGAQTLNQMLLDMNEQHIPIPACNIVDYPDIKRRAVHIDLKHHLDDISYYYSVIDRLSEMKVNAVILEFEDKLKYQRVPLAGASHAIPIADFASLSRYAQERFIKISPLVQGLGHASFILKHPTYSHLREDPSSDWVFSPLDSGTYEVLFALYDDAIEATPYGDYVHIGGDEVGTLGQSELSKSSKMTAFELQMHWLRKVSKYIVDKGRVPIFWDDMVFKLKGLYETTYDDHIPLDSAKAIWDKNINALQDNIALFPPECIFMRWNYSTPWTYGNDRAISWYRDNNLRVMGATAAQQVAPMMPRDQSNFKAIKEFAKIAKENNLEEMLCTVWDDSSPHFETVWRGLYYFAALNWNYQEINAELADSLFNYRFYGLNIHNNGYTFQDQLEKSVAFWDTALLMKGHRYKYPVDSMETELLAISDFFGDGTWSELHRERLSNAKNCILTYSEIREKIHNLQAHATRNQFTLAVFNQINDLHVFPALLLVALEKYDRAKNDAGRLLAIKEIENLLDRYDHIRAAFSEVFYEVRFRGNPDDYILDTNFHHHLANGTKNDDWMHVYELEFLFKIREWLSLKED
ncbi:glycoside hydrolase family 20 zincin-like fold domain-containing protein [Sphingobacterium chuzhouense]|uniref:Family 20 glycosylhydrolase n=1 Tax=Sphingobacterium chuzhouense TaxID=1742264 RepID=A0ABR7XTW2_9SPHI|nr:glycoside hydrolase family 20 zincin-like fold domain-containing protein [Sphingobacterium chuzhouense]MBD1422029.1 family 20 glycosylhydrolase [Sphingobacterium chuzhouense]